MNVAQQCLPLLLAQGGVSRRTAQFFMVWVVVGVIATAVLQPFTRRIGGNQADDGGPGGSEAGIIGAIWFAAAIATGIYMAS